MGEYLKGSETKATRTVWAENALPGAGKQILEISGIHAHAGSNAGGGSKKWHG